MYVADHTLTLGLLWRICGFLEVYPQGITIDRMIYCPGTGKSVRADQSHSHSPEGTVFWTIDVPHLGACSRVFAPVAVVSLAEHFNKKLGPRDHTAFLQAFKRVAFDSSDRSRIAEETQLQYANRSGTNAYALASGIFLGGKRS